MKSTPVLFVYFARVCHIYAHSIGANQETPSYCLNPKAPGNTCGRGPFTSWYFDSESRKCKAFTFGGCNGNLNRFSSEGQCQRWWLRGVPEKPVCSLAVEKGKGLGAFSHGHIMLHRTNVKCSCTAGLVETRTNSKAVISA
uniref:Putative bovine pancreatic trypsin inhibitor n=1 Tax=Rhipicephalus microplus TaxID=6941 RepID=A0A6G5A9M5_RHIMP